MLGIKPNRIMDENDEVSETLQNNTTPDYNAKSEIELPPVEQEEKQEEADFNIPGESNEDIFADLQGPEDINPCPPKKKNSLFGSATVSKSEDASSVKIPWVYLGMGLALLKYAF